METWLHLAANGRHVSGEWGQQWHPQPEQLWPWSRAGAGAGSAAGGGAGPAGGAGSGAGSGVDSGAGPGAGTSASAGAGSGACAMLVLSWDRQRFAFPPGISVFKMSLK